MSRRFALDTDVLSALMIGHPALVALGQLPVVVSDRVWDEFLDPGGSPVQLQRAEQLVKAIAGGPTVIEPESAAAAAFTHLSTATPQIGGGECSTIALAMSDPDIRVVLNDRRAAYRALDELRERVVTVHAFIEAMTVAGLSRKEAESIAAEYRRRNQMTPPRWWPPTTTPRSRTR